MSTTDESLDPRSVLLYFGGIALTVASLTLGLLLHWVAALTGPGTGLFGIDAWAGAFGALPVVVGGIWAWRSGRRNLGRRMKIAGRVAVMLLGSAAMLGAGDLLTASWSMRCSENRPDLCYQLGSMLESDDPETIPAFRTACRGGHVDGCHRIVDRKPDPPSVQEACRRALTYCRRARRCRIAETNDACRPFTEPVTLPRPDARKCRTIVDDCSAVVPDGPQSVQMM